VLTSSIRYTQFPAHFHPTHIHTHAYTRIHTDTHIHTHSCTRTHKHTHTHTHIRIRTHTDSKLLLLVRHGQAVSNALQEQLGPDTWTDTESKCSYTDEDGKLYDLFDAGGRA